MNLHRMDIGIDTDEPKDAGAPESINAAWLHDMRDAVNTVALSAAVAKTLMEHGEPDRALELLDELEHACDRCRALMSQLHRT